MRTTTIKTSNTVYVDENSKGEVVFKNGDGETLSVVLFEDGGFQVHYSVEPENTEHYKNVGLTQFKGGVIRRPGEEGYDFNGH